MKILYIGAAESWTTSRHRADAITRLGHEVDIVDFSNYLPENKILKRVIFLSGRIFGFKLLSRLICRKFDKAYSPDNYDLLWVNQERFLNKPILRKWTHKIPSIIYINDNPFFGEQKKLWTELIETLSLYTIVAVVRDEDYKAALKLGCQHPVKVWMSYDEIMHKTLPESDIDKKKWESDVLFVGSYMKERGPFLVKLIESSVPLTIYGSNWNQAKEWTILKKHWVGDWIQGEEYVKAIQYAKIVLGLLSEGNRDYHTQRTMEVPYIGSLFCCKRTHEHEELYQDGIEAVMWENAQECANKCLELLKQPENIRKISSAGHQRVLKNNVSNEAVCGALIEKATR